MDPLESLIINFDLEKKGKIFLKIEIEIAFKSFFN